MRAKRNTLLVSLPAICLGAFCIREYFCSVAETGLSSRLLGLGTRLLSKSANVYSPEVFRSQTLHYVSVLIWLFPAWVFLSLGLSGLARIAWRRRPVDFFLRHSPSTVIALAIAAFFCSFAINTFVLKHQPITMGDEYCYTFQAKLFASGRLYSTAGAGMKEFYNLAVITSGPRRYAIGFPGHPLVLSLGLLAGKMHLVPPLLAGVSVILLYLIAGSLFSKGTALIATLLMTASPFYLMFHGTLLPQSSLIPCLLLFLLCVVRMIGDWKWYWLLVGAVALFLATVIRPMSVILFAGPIGFYMLVFGAAPLRRRLLISVVCIVAVLLGTGALCVFSSLTSGQPLALRLAPRPPGALPYSYGLGFHDECRHTPIKGLVNTAKALLGWNYYLFGWPISVLPALLWLFRRGKLGWEYVLAVSIVCYYVFYFFYCGTGWHYYLDTIPLLAILSALALNVSGVRRISDPGRVNAEDSHSREAPRFSHIVLVVGIALSVFSWPSALGYLKGRSAPVQEVSEVISRANVRNALVLLDNLPKSEMNAIIGSNSPDLDDDVVIARKLPGDEWHRTVQMFPGRSVWEVRGDANGSLICSPLK